MTIIHKDWPAVPSKGTFKYSWEFDGAIGDLKEALESAVACPASIQSTDSESLELWDVATIERYKLRYHGNDWGPSDHEGGTELELNIVGTLKDGRWFSIEAWNDYTGWGCQDGSEVRIGATEAEVVNFGLTKEGRASLGYSEPVQP